jgi:hypothetical protein
MIDCFIELKETLFPSKGQTERLSLTIKAKMGKDSQYWMVRHLISAGANPVEKIQDKHGRWVSAMDLAIEKRAITLVKIMADLADPKREDPRYDRAHEMADAAISAGKALSNMWNRRVKLNSSARQSAQP